MPTITQPEPSPSPTPIPVRAAFDSMKAKREDWADDLETVNTNADSIDDPVTMRNLIAFLRGNAVIDGSCSEES